MIARNTEHLVTRLAQLLEEMAGLLELLGPGALGEIAADHDQVGLQFVGLALDRFDEVFVVRAEVQVRQMDEASHPSVNALQPCRFTGRKLRSS